MLRFIDLFCGLGAFHLGLQAASIDAQCVFACDIDATVAATYEQNFAIKPASDIRQVDASDIPEFDLLCAGSPCQSHSIAGKKEGLQDEERGQLIFQLFRIAQHHKPKYMIIENVKNLMHVSDGAAFKLIQQRIQGLGYTMHHKVLNSARYGSAQARERLYMVCIRSDLDQPFKFPAPIDDASHTVRTILDPSEASNMISHLEEKYDISYQELPTRPFKAKVVGVLTNRDSGKCGRQGERIYSIEHPSPTICASSGGPGPKTGLYQLDNGVVRTLNTVEVKRLFGFPQSYSFNCSERKMLGYLGNSIVVPVLKEIFKELL